MADNFANFDEEWIKENGKRWERNGKVRYYFNSVFPVFRLLGIKYEMYNTGNFRSVDGMSNTAATKLRYGFKDTYFDAVAGKFVGDTSIQSELEDELIRRKSERVARQAVNDSLNGKSEKRAGAKGSNEPG